MNGYVFERFNRTIYNMCTQKQPYDYSQELYDRYEFSFNQYIKEKVIPTLEEKQGEYMLKSLVTRWDNHKLMVRWLSRFFNYLDRYYVQRHHIAPLNDVGINCFRSLVYEKVKVNMMNAVLELIDRDRDGEKVDRVLIKNITGIFVQMGMGTMEAYQNDFEKDLLAHTAAFYGRKASQWIAEDSCPEYLIKAEECLNSERERVQQYLDRTTEAKLIAKVEHHLLEQFETELLDKENSGCSALLMQDKVSDLARMFRLFSSVPKGLQPIAEKFKQHVTKEGIDLVQSSEKAVANAKKGEKISTSVEQTFTRSAIDLYDKYSGYVNECFSGSHLFNRALKEAFEFFCNKGVAGNSTAQLLADFADKLLRKGGAEKLSDEKMEQTLDKIVKLLAYVSDKDMFGEFHRKKLAKRLLGDSSASQDYERSILSKLKTQCGAQFTSRMEGMVNDLQLTRETQENFEKWIDDSPSARKPATDLSVTVLTNGFWPQYKIINLELADEFEQCVTTFEQYHAERMSGRKLTWIHGMSTCTLMVGFDAAPKELLLSMLQCSVLLLFRTEKELTMQKTVELTKMAEDDVKRALHSLACSKYKILNKTPEGKTIGSDDVFTFNEKFTDRQRRIRIPNPPLDDKKATIEHVEHDRRLAIDAAVVRTMKTRKSLAYSQLIIEVVAQLEQKFLPDVKLIKKQIESLIEREFIERDRENPNVFIYLA